ncbi:metallophosphoesterase domain-containing protein 1-like [Mustelus asterias]
MSNSTPEPKYLRMQRDAHGQGYRLEELKGGTPVGKGYVRFVCISDTHQHTAGLRLPRGDVLIHAGDFTNCGYRREIENFGRWLGSCHFPQKVVIAGNHELPFDRMYMRPGDYENLGIGSDEEVSQLLGDCTYLQDSGAMVQGFKVYGSPWQPAFCNWAFNLTEEEQLREKWDRIPSDTDILITHGPPRGE